MKAISDFIPKVIEIDDWRFKIFQNWDNIIGNLKNQVKLENIKKETVIIGIFEVHWLHEVHLLSSVLIKKINNFLEAPKIKKLKLQLIKKAKITKIKKSENKAIQKTVTLNKQQENALQKISDQQLKENLTNYLSRCLG